MYLVFDGGNGGHKVMKGYGSFRIYTSKGGRLLAGATRIEYEGTMTNNEAEYRTLLEALRTWVVLDNNSPLLIEGDSELVRLQVLGQWQVTEKGEHLLPYLNKIHLLLLGVDYTYLHASRAEIYAVFGH